MAAQVMCTSCGYRGFESLSSFRRRHLIYHDEHFNGVRLRRLELFERVGSIGSADVLLVRPKSMRFARLRTERVARRAIEEPVFEGGYDKPTFYAENPYQIVPEHCSHALVVAQDCRGVGLLVFERRERRARYTWRENEAKYVLDIEHAAGPAWTVVHIWLLPSMRGNHIASQLLHLAFAGFGVSPDNAAWLSPFTPDGFRLLRRFAPEEFWAAGDEPPQSHVFPRPFG